MIRRLRSQVRYLHHRGLKWRTVGMRKLRRVRATECRDSSKSRSDEWIDNEVMGCKFQDVRHGKRMRQLLEQLSGKIGATTPWTSQDWANSNAAYRFFGNEGINEANILAGHFASPRDRFVAGPTTND